MLSNKLDFNTLYDLIMNYTYLEKSLSSYAFNTGLQPDNHGSKKIQEEKKQHWILVIAHIHHFFFSSSQKGSIKLFLISNTIFSANVGQHVDCIKFVITTL